MSGWLSVAEHCPPAGLLVVLAVSRAGHPSVDAVPMLCYRVLTTGAGGAVIQDWRTYDGREFPFYYQPEAFMYLTGVEQLKRINWEESDD